MSLEPAGPEEPVRYNVRVVETPVRRELWVYGKVHSSGGTKARRPKRRPPELEGEELVRWQELRWLRARFRREKYYKDRVQRLRRLVECNYRPRGEDCPGSKFVLLTYGDEGALKPVPAACWPDVRDFLARLREYLEARDGACEPLRWLAVPEIQEQRARKYGERVVHWHLIVFGLPYVAKEPDLRSLWGHGIVGIEEIESTAGACRYLVKYLGKSFGLDSPSKQKAYHSSRGLVRPGEWVDRVAPEDLECLAEGVGETVYDYRYGTPTGESIRYLAVEHVNEVAMNVPF